MARGMVSPRHVPNRRRTREGPEPACMQTLLMEWHMQVSNGELNVLPWCRQVGVAKTSSEVATWYGNRQARLSWMCAQVTGKAGENGHHSGEMGGSSPWKGPSAPGSLKAWKGDRPWARSPKIISASRMNSNPTSRRLNAGR